MSLFDDYAEYESASLQHPDHLAAAGSFAGGSLDDAISPANPLGSDVAGYVTTTLEAEDAPIFSLDRVQFQVPNQIISLAVANDVLVLVIEGAKVLRINLQEAHNILEADIPVKPTDLKACNAFLDPTGRHLLISTPQGENYYHYEGWDQAKPLSKFKNMEITAVAWNSMSATSANSSTRTILLGTHDGKIYETELRPGNDAKAKRSDVAARRAGELPVRERITGIAMEPFPTRLKQHLVLVATGTRIYQIVGAADLGSGSGSNVANASSKAAVFESMLTEGLANPNFQEIPGMPGPGSLAVHHSEAVAGGKPQIVATDFAWLTSMGVFFGKLAFDAQEAGDSVIENASLLPYPSSPSSAPGTDNSTSTEQPINLSLTEFHIVLQYAEHVQTINMLNCKLAFDERIAGRDGETLQGLVVDDSKQTYWLFSPSNIYELVLTDEDRDVWDIYLSRRQFEAALARCYNEAQRDRVLRAQAEHLFDAGDYTRSADCFARTSVSFEQAVLKFVDIKDSSVLKSYLLSRLDTLRKQDLTQITLLVMWLIEIYLSMLGAIDAKIAASTAAGTATASGSQAINGANQQAQSDALPALNGEQQSDTAASYEKEKKAVEDELYSLVERHQNAVDPKTAYQLAESHGRRDFWLYYATLRGDYGRVVEYWMEKEEYLRAIEVLGHYGTPEMFYKYSPELMGSSSAGKPNQPIRYLRFCIQKQMCRDPIVYNYYLTLLVKESTSSDESDLMAFLATYGKDMLYDPDYALRICKRYGRIQSCVHLYSLLKLYEDAVELALAHEDVELAQIHAERPENDNKLCKRLWLKIAQHVIKANKPASEVMDLVRRSNRLGVEDILPFFPDFTCVDDFKDDICTSLEDYEMQIQDLRAEMDEATRTAEAMQRDMKNLKNRFAILNAEEACQVCDQPLWLRQFYVFPCQHSFHADCLTRRVVSACNRVQRRRIHELQSQSVEIMKQRRQIRLTPLAGRGNREAGPQESDEQLEQQLRRVKKQLDALVAGECVLCGEAMIKSIAEPFVDADQDADDSWKI
ncbi:tethering complex subunit [Dipsacomyces acuminosporus]|nr:tethering complex subunit [Dipsacomyces acuminosporus]